MRNILISLFLFGALVPFLVESASFDEYTYRGNGTSQNDFIPRKYVLKPEQKELVDLFRTTYSDLLTDQYLNTDAHIAGLLEANKWNLLGASKALRKLLAWRTKNKVDDYNYEEINPELLKRFPWRVRTTTHNGCPVLEIGWGRWLVADYIQSQEFTRDAVNNYNKHSDQMWERARWATKKVAPKCEQGVLLADIKGFLMKNVAEVNALNTVIRMALTLNDKYSNLYERIICFNAPPDFVSLMKVLQPSLGVTAKSFSIYSEDEADLAKQHIASYVDLSTVSPYYFGTRTD